MGRATKVTQKGKEPDPVSLTVGWSGRLGEIVTILSRGSAKNNLPARPVGELLLARFADSPALNRAMLRGGKRVRQLGRRIVLQTLGPGVKPDNAPSTARRKGGDRRALRNVRGRDALYRQFQIFVRNLRTGEFAG